MKRIRGCECPPPANDGKHCEGIHWITGLSVSAHTCKGINSGGLGCHPSPDFGMEILGFDGSP